MGKINVLVTGSSGFIGSKLLDYKQSEYNFIPFKGDLLSVPDIKGFFENNPKISQIVHLAGIFSADTKKLFDVNVDGTFNLLDVAKDYKVKKVIFSSSGAVYGEPIGEKSLETDPLNPNTVYGLTKSFAEQSVKYFKDNYGIDYVILRFPNVYGPGNLKGVVYSLLSSVKKSGYVTIYGDGKQSRNFLRVEDAIYALLLALEFCENEVFNISTETKLSINSLVKCLSTTYEFDIRYAPANNKLADLLLNTTKSRELLKFTPKFDDLTYQDIVI